MPTIESGVVALAGGAPSALTASADTSIAFASEISRLFLQNNSLVPVGFEFDATATVGSPQLAPGQTLDIDISMKILHCYSTAATPINGSAGGNLIVKGWG